MNVYETLELFSESLKNEIIHYVSDDSIQDALLNAIDECKAEAIDTYRASSK